MANSVATAGDKFEADAQQLVAMANALGLERPSRVQLGFLAGPNDIVQWVLDLETWQQIGLAVGSWLVTKVADEVWSVGVDKIRNSLKRANKPEKDFDVDRLLFDLRALIEKVNAKGGDFTIRLADDPVHPARRAGALADRGTYVSIPITEDTTDLAAQLVLIAEHAAAIQSDEVSEILIETREFGGHIRRTIRVRSAPIEAVETDREPSALP